MLSLLVSLALAASSKLEVEEEPIEVGVPRLGEKDDAAVLDALVAIQKPPSNAALHHAAQTCALLGVDAAKPIAAAKSGSSETLDDRVLAIADGYLGLGDWVNAEKALRTVRSSPRVDERLGRVLRAQSRFADAARVYVAAVGAASGAELEEIMGRIEPVVTAWVADFEAGHSGLMHDAAKSVLTAMLPHQAGAASEATKSLLARLEPRPPAAKPVRSVLTAARLKDAIAVQVAALRGCYARALVHEPTLKGKLVLNFSVEDGGKVSSLRTISNSTDSKALQGCIEPRIKALYLVTETPVEVTYPLVLNPL